VRRVLQESNGSHGSDRPRPHALLALSLLAIGLAAAGCSSSANGPTTSSSIPVTPTSTIALPPTSTTTATSAEDAAVLAAYRAAWNAFEGALKTANAFDPALPATMVNPILEQVKKGLVSDEVGGIIAKGGVTLNPQVVSTGTSTARIIDCLSSTSELVYRKSGMLVPPVTKPEHDGVRATLTLVGSTWKVSQQTVTEGKCSGES
jgi:hypothetical protein